MAHGEQPQWLDGGHLAQGTPGEVARQNTQLQRPFRYADAESCFCPIAFGRCHHEKHCGDGKRGVRNGNKARGESNGPQICPRQEGKGDGNERGNEPKESVETWTCGEQYDADHEGDAAD